MNRRDFLKLASTSTAASFLPIGVVCGEEYKKESACYVDMSDLREKVDRVASEGIVQYTYSYFIDVKITAGKGHLYADGKRLMPQKQMGVKIGKLNGNPIFEIYNLELAEFGNRVPSFEWVS